MINYYNYYNTTKVLPFIVDVSTFNLWSPSELISCF